MTEKLRRGGLNYVMVLIMEGDALERRGEREGGVVKKR